MNCYVNERPGQHPGRKPSEDMDTTTTYDGTGFEEPTVTDDAIEDAVYVMEYKLDHDPYPDDL